MDNPGKTHCEAVKQVFCYLLGTKNWELINESTEDSLKGYTNADGILQEH